MTTEHPQTEIWAIVELFGHSRIAGRISEHVIGGNFVRVDVPAVGGRPAFTKLYGANAIYAMTFVDHDVALAAAERMGIVPISTYNLADVTTEAVRQRLIEARPAARDPYTDPPW
jgi:hypothetical protein